MRRLTPYIAITTIILVPYIAITLLIGLIYFSIDKEREDNPIEVEEVWYWTPQKDVNN